MLDKKGINTRVVSVPSMELFEKQSKAYKAKVMGTEKIRIAVEAGLRQGWDRFIGAEGTLHRHDRLWRKCSSGSAV